MVVIECPHCSEDIEMDDDAYGLFECPYCSGEYEWGEAPKTTIKKKTSKYNFKSRDIIKERTRNIGSSNTSNRSKPKREYNTVLQYNALNFTSLAINTVLLFIIIIGLNSNSWYGFSYSDDGFDGEGDGEIEANFGISYVEYTITEEERPSYWDEDLTYYYFGGSMINYESQLAQAKANLESTEEMCEDWEENDQCDTIITQAQESVDFWNSWDSAGSFLLGLLIFTLILLIATLSSKLLIFFNHNEWLFTNDEMMKIVNKTENIATLVTSSMLIIGLLMYWLFLPNIENWWDILDDTPPAGLSSGLGLIWWMTLLTSLILIISSTFESMANKKAN
tara:strand:+ start:1561 stop:2568 length:1008 start_codon:yes stop_codon:yes gene_type:complete